MDCGEEIGGGLEVAGCDASVVFQTIEEALDEIAAALERRIDRADDADVALARDVSGGARGLDGRNDRLAEVAAIGDDIATQRQGGEQLGRGGLVGGLPRGEHRPHQQAATVDDGVDFGSQSPARATDGVIRTPLLPPAACWWARMMELSIKCSESGDICRSHSKTLSHTPCLAQRL